MPTDTTSIIDLSVIVPVYNEEESLPELDAEIRAALGSLDRAWEVVYVDDGSRDRSLNVLEELQAKHADNTQVIELRRNFGQTAALAAGFDYSTGEVIVPLDADLQNDPANIPDLLQSMEEGDFDVVSGWRKSRMDDVSRTLPSRIANRIISKVTGVHLNDYGCTLKAYRRDVVDHIRLYGELHRFLPALAAMAGARVTELPVNHRPRKYGSSKYGIDRTKRVILDLITIKFLMSYSTKPMQVFGSWGIFAFVGGLLFGLLAVGLKLFEPGHDVTSNPWMYLTIFLTLFGLQLIGMGLLGELNMRTYYESQRKPIYTVRSRRKRKQVS